MKKTILLVAVLVTGTVLATTPRNMGVSLDLSPVLTGGLGARYEYRISEFVKLTVPLEVKSVKLSPLPSEAINGLRLYAWSTLPELTVLTGLGVQLNYMGWYIEPMFKLGYAEIVYLGLTGTKNLFLLQPIFLFGYSETFENGFLINFGLGFGVRYFMPSQDAMSFWSPDGVLAVGYAW
jgi:hypothetical protein